MKAIKTITILLFGVILSACDAESELAVAQQTGQAGIGSFHIEIDGLVQFDQTGSRAKSFNYEHDYWEFSANGAKLRMATRFEEEKMGAEQKSDDLEHNNVYLEFMHKVANKNTKVSCKAAQEPKGLIKRTIHNDLSNSGSFSIELVLCRNTYTSEPVAEINTPLIVKGQFKKVPNQQSLF